MKRYNLLSEQDKQNIIDLYYKNIDLVEIQNKLGVSGRSVTRVLKEAGINTRRKNRYTLNEHFFSEIDTEEKAYVLGFIYADGYVGDEKTNNIVISLNEGDKELLEKIVGLIEFTGDLRYVAKNGGYENSQPGWVLNFSSVQMATDLRKNGVYPGKSLTMEYLPDLDEELIRHFIRGYFDGDGTVGIYDNRSQYTTKDGTVKTYEYRKPEVLILGTKAFIEKIGEYIPAKWSVQNAHTDNMIYLNSSGKENCNRIYEYLYDDATIYLQRKFNKWQEVRRI